MFESTLVLEIHNAKDSIISIMNNTISNNELCVAICISGSFFVLAIVSGRLIASPIISTEVIQNLESTLTPLKGVHPLLLCLIIFINNALKSLLVILFGILAGIPGLIFIYANGVIIGIVLSFATSAKGWQFAAASTLPHGIIEIPVLLLTVALSLLIGWESLRWLMRRQSNIKSKLTFGITTYLKLILPGLFLAALIETFATPLIASAI